MKRKSEAVNLTARQMECLRELDLPKSVAHFMPYMGRFNENPYWFLSGSHARVTQAIERLHELRLVDITSSDPYGGNTTATINAAGRALLRAAKPKGKVKR